MPLIRYGPLICQNGSCDVAYVRVLQLVLGKYCRMLLIIEIYIYHWFLLGFYLDQLINYVSQLKMALHDRSMLSAIFLANPVTLILLCLIQHWFWFMYSYFNLVLFTGTLYYTGSIYCHYKQSKSCRLIFLPA